MLPSVRLYSGTLMQWRRGTGNIANFPLEIFCCQKIVGKFFVGKIFVEKCKIWSWEKPFWRNLGANLEFRAPCVGNSHCVWTLQILPAGWSHLCTHLRKRLDRRCHFAGHLCVLEGGHAHTGKRELEIGTPCQKLHCHLFDIRPAAMLLWHFCVKNFLSAVNEIRRYSALEMFVVLSYI